MESIIAYLCTPITEGSIAQLVQSICLTSRGSAVRARVLPQKTSHLSEVFLFYCYVGLRPTSKEISPTPWTKESENIIPIIRALQAAGVIGL
jgi:hypothetical protein